MSIIEEFFNGIGAIDLTPPQQYSPEPDPNRYMEALDLLQDHDARLKALDTAKGNPAETGMLTPRLTVREHTDMHVLMRAMDKFGSKEMEDWISAVQAYGMGYDGNQLEDLKLYSRDLIEMASLRQELSQIHTAWAADKIAEDAETPAEFPTENE